MLIDSVENQQKILHHFLELCCLEGWSSKTLEAAFVKADIDVKFVNLIFANGASDVADLFVRNIDEKMIREVEKIDLSQMKISDKIKALIKIRLNLNLPYQQQIKKLISFYSQPSNAIYGFKNIYHSADLMWKLIGDNATDFNFYSKRIILSKVYIRVLFCFARDDSANHQKTFDLLDSQIKKVVQFTAFKFKLKNSINKISNPKDFIKKLPFFRLYK